MSDMDMSFNFKEMEQFQKALDRLGKLPQKVVNKAAGKGATVAGRAIRAAAPKGRTRQLSKGFKRKPEKSKTPGKKVFSYAMDPAKNDIFQKPIKNPGVAGGERPHAYYPHSIEYGFLTRKAGGGLAYVQGKGKEKVEGKHFTRRAAEGARPQVESTIIKTAISELKKEWQKK